MGRKAYDEEKALTSLIKKASTYLDSNFHKFQEERKYSLAKAVVEKRITTLKSENNEGNVYHIYNDFRSKLRELGPDGIREVMGFLRNRVSKV